MNQIAFLSQVMPLFTTSRTLKTSIMPSSVNILRFLKENDVQTVLMVYKELGEGCPHESRSVRIARIALKTAIQTLDKQVDEVYDQVKKRRNTVFGHIRGEAYTCDVRSLQASIESQLSIVQKRRALLQEVLGVQHSVCPCFITPMPSMTSVDEDKTMEDLMADMVLLD